MSAILQLFSLLAANVLIFDLGSLVVFRQYRRIQTQIDKQDTIVGGNVGAAGGFNRVNSAVSQLDAASEMINMFTRAGMIHFSDNQCKLNPRNREVSIALSSILIVGLADVGFHDNQSSCNIPRSILLTNALLFAGTGVHVRSPERDDGQRVGPLFENLRYPTSGPA
jgi:preprotein translocase subunit Sec61beta